MNCRTLTSRDEWWPSISASGGGFGHRGCRWTVDRGGRQLTQPVTDSVEDRRLQPYRVLEAVEGVEEAAYSCLTLGRQRPLEVLPLELLGGGVHGAVVLGGVEQAPSDQGGQGPLERGVVYPLLPPHRAQGPPHLVEVERGGTIAA